MTAMWERPKHNRWYRPRRGIDPAAQAQHALVDRQRAVSVVAAVMRHAHDDGDWQQIVRLGGLHAWIVLDGQADAA